MSIRALTVLAFIVLSCSACGVRGQLEVPATSTPAAEPADQSAPDDDPTFVLDGLLL